jgi:hypothetical protein
MDQMRPKLHHVVRSLYTAVSVAAVAAPVAALVAELLVPQTAAFVFESVVTVVVVVVAAAAVAKTETLTI